MFNSRISISLQNSGSSDIYFTFIAIPIVDCPQITTLQYTSAFFYAPAFPFYNAFNFNYTNVIVNNGFKRFERQEMEQQRKANSGLV